MIIDGIKKWLFKNNTNGLQIMDDGSLRAIGTASLFDDITGDVMSKRLYSSTGTIDYDFDEQAVKMQPSGDLTDKNDRLAFNLQVPHRADLVNPYFCFHLHFWQTDSTERSFQLEYRLQNNDHEKNTTWTSISATTASDCKFTYTSGTLNQIIQFPSFDTTGVNISSTYQIRFTRKDSNSGDVYMTFADMHYAIDSEGSMTEWSKNG